MEEEIFFEFIEVGEDLTVARFRDDENNILKTYSFCGNGWYCVDSGNELHGEIYNKLMRAYRGWRHNMRFKAQLAAFKRQDA